ncbi:unnamed protein product [Caenorhabditis angaria]|uniref:DH domain-containing protein n=1 Tax=Caenorhabditis angaria TaxID=860376 RepID=A0A9P1J4G0_9PELO|nr:unnamed protein product [Caenorhabditis angaria]
MQNQICDIASTSDGPPIMCSSTNEQFIEAPAFFYDMDTDFKQLRNDLECVNLLNDFGYQSIVERSRHPFMTSSVLNERNTFDSEDDEQDDQWDGYLTVGSDRIKIKDMSDILATRYAILSGARTNDGLSIVTFPDSRTTLSFEDYSLLIVYMLQSIPLEGNNRSFVVIVDRRSDKWSSVRTLLLQITSFFPGTIQVVYIIKPEGVLQRALEVGYRGIAGTCNFEIVQLESSVELRKYFRAEQLTMDVGGIIKYNHLEWVQHRMDIERMKSSATAIATALSEFGRTLRETELPNDVDTTARILEAQTAEKDAIKEDFRISVRKGTALLRSVRQLDRKPTAEQLSPTRLHNVTSIERMLIQLEETEKSFDAFWAKHETRLSNCLQLRQFEEKFRKLQAAFARHMLYLEEHREIGDGCDKAVQLAEQHRVYAERAKEDITGAIDLKKTGEQMISLNEAELCGSLLPKCEELERMADALTGALERRSTVLNMSKSMHEQILKANSWCKAGVDILTSSLPPEPHTSNINASINKMDEFLEEGSNLKFCLDALDNPTSWNNLILMTTTETSTLLAQVAERIDDIRRMSVARRNALSKMCDAKKPQPPIQVVTPEKKKTKNGKNLEQQQQIDMDSKDNDCCFGDRYPTEGSSTSQQSTPTTQPIITNNTSSMETFVIAELLNTERSYVAELASLIEFYVDPFESPEYQSLIPSQIRGKSDIVFGNLRDLLNFHSRYVLTDLQANEFSLAGICRIFLQHRNDFLKLYRTYCQYKATSEALRKEYTEANSFFNECQKRASHPLPLGAYLLKPVQRITKYQLLLRELERYCQPNVKDIVNDALRTMLELLTQINAAIHQLHISGFNGDLRVLGPLRLQSECDVYSYNRKKKAKLSRVQRRFLFLFDGGVMFCKKRTPSSTQPSTMDPEYYEHKICIPILSLGFAETSRTGASRFELWDEAKVDAYVIESIDSASRQKWIDRLSKTVGSNNETFSTYENRQQRPESWASTVSNESSCSSSTRDSNSGDSQMDTNGNSHMTLTDQYASTEEPLDISKDTESEVELVDSC